MTTVFQTPLLFPPGDRWKYSNSNYYLLGLMIEKISGMTYADFVTERIFRPLGMSVTRLNDYRPILAGRAAGYHFQDNSVQNAGYISPSQRWAAGGVISSVADLAKWIVALDSATLLKRDVLQQMWTAAKVRSGEPTGYGLGTELDSVKEHRIIGHQGGGLAFNASFIFLPQDRLGVVVLTNLTQGPSEIMARHIAAIFLPDLSDEGNAGIPDQNPKITELFRDTLRDAAQGQADAARIAPESRERLVPFLQTTGPRFLDRLGALESVTLLDEASKDGKQVRRYRTVFASGQKIVWTVVSASDGTLVSLDPRPE